MPSRLSSYVLAALLLVAPFARAQDPDALQAEYSEAFSAGLEAITRRDLARSEALFKRCVQLRPDQPVAYYNLACTYSLGEKTDAAVEMLREAFKRGFVDVSHMTRDTDLDAIRRTPAFRGALAEFEAALLGQVGPALSHVPQGAPAGVLVWVHDQGVAPARDLERLRTILPNWAILVPQGLNVRAGFAWDERVEFVVVERLRAFAAELGGRAPRALIAGDGDAGVMALLVASQHPDLVAGVLASGPRLGSGVEGDVAPSGLRAYLVVHKDDAAQVEDAVRARDQFVRAKSAVVLERYPLANPLAQDRAILLRALSWLQGQPVQLPGAGVELTF
jgi:hypothetical protein